MELSPDRIIFSLISADIISYWNNSGYSGKNRISKRKINLSDIKGEQVMDIVLQVRNFLHFDSLVTASFLSICLTRKKKKKNNTKKQKRWWHRKQQRWISSAYCTDPWGVLQPCFMALKRTKATTEPLKLRTIHLMEPNSLNWLYICRVCDRKTMLTWQISNISLNGWVKSKVTAWVLICLWLSADQWLQG